MLFIVMLLLTRPDKRTSSVFIMNAISLMLNIVRNVLLCLFFTSAFNESYAYFAGDYSRVPQSDYATSVTGTVFELLTLISIEISLCLQVRVVCVTLQRMNRMMIFCLSTIIALMAIGLRFAYMVKNSILIMETMPLDSLYQLGSVTNIATSISICWFSLVFVTKLGVALRARSKLGMGQFGSMQIIFIVGCQTLIIPGNAISPSILQRSANNSSQPYSPFCNTLSTTQPCHPKSSPLSSSSYLYHPCGPLPPSRAGPRPPKRSISRTTCSAATLQDLRGCQS